MSTDSKSYDRIAEQAIQECWNGNKMGGVIEKESAAEAAKETTKSETPAEEKKEMSSDMNSMKY